MSLVNSGIPALIVIGGTHVADNSLMSDPKKTPKLKIWPILTKLDTPITLVVMVNVYL
jgi:hypothetical protein